MCENWHNDPRRAKSLPFSLSTTGRVSHAPRGERERRAEREIATRLRSYAHSFTPSAANFLLSYSPIASPTLTITFRPYSLQLFSSFLSPAHSHHFRYFARTVSVFRMLTSQSLKSIHVWRRSKVLLLNPVSRTVGQGLCARYVMRRAPSPFPSLLCLSNTHYQCSLTSSRFH